MKRDLIHRNLRMGCGEGLVGRVLEVGQAHRRADRPASVGVLQVPQLIEPAQGVEAPLVELTLTCPALLAQQVGQACK